MPGTSAGAAKTRDKNLANNPNHYHDAGVKGGKVKVPKGFAKMSQMKRSLAGKRGGSVTGENYRRNVSNIYQAINDPSLRGQMVRREPSVSKLSYYLPVIRFVYIAIFLLVLVLIGYLGLKASGAI